MSNSRRNFILKITSGIAGAITLPNLPLIGEPLEYQTKSDPNKEIGQQPGKKLGIALVRLGKYSTEQLAPALEKAKNCRLAGIVSGSPEKVEKWMKKYNIPEKNTYNYQNFDSIKDNPEIDIVYVVLPNSMHAEYTIRAAKAGKHVISEKPMATTVKDCEAMIAACKEAGKMLSIGYRLHFEPHHHKFIDLGNGKSQGKVKKVIAHNAHKVEKDVWRIDKELSGGGALMDLGVYCVQGAIYSVGEMPNAVTARFGEKKDKEKFDEVEESFYWKLEFPGGATAECYSSYNDKANLLRAETENGWMELQPAFEYSGIKGKSNQGNMDIENVEQQTRQMDDFAQCILEDKPTKVPGEMGLRDVKVLTAILEAGRTGKRIEIS